MADNNPRMPKRSWRDNPPSGATPKRGRRAWQKEQGREAAGPWLTKKTKAILAGGAFVVVAAILLAVAFWPKPIKPFRLVLLGAGYETNLAVPANAYGQRGLNELAAWAGEYNDHWASHKDQGIDIRQQTLAGDPDAVLDEALKDCKSPTVLVYLAVHAGKGEREGPYLLPDDYSPRTPGLRYRFSKVLDALVKLPDKKKLLVLDVTGISSDWSLGLFFNDFARELETLVQQRRIPNLVVLSASGPNQRSWVAEEAGRTVFAHYVLEGLKGAAQTNGQITAGGLARYVMPRVERWVLHNRNASQKPVLIDPDALADSMELVRAESNYSGSDPQLPDKITVPESLVDAWTRREELEQAVPHPSVYTPHWWREYLDRLLRYEELLRAGDEKSARLLEPKLDDLHKRIKAAQRLEYSCLANSLPMPVALGLTLPAEKTQRLQNMVEDLWEKRAPADEYRRVLSDLQKTAADPREKQLIRVRFAGLLLEKAQKSEESFNRVCLWDRDLNKRGPLYQIDDVQDPRPAEAHFALTLRRDLPSGNAPAWDLLKQALAVRLQAEQAALGLSLDSLSTSPFAAFSEQVLPWIRAHVDAGDATRCPGEDRLFGAATEANQADKALKDAEAQYKAAQDKAIQVREALHWRDRALAELPYYSHWLAGLDLGPQEEEIHASLWDNLHKLCALLEKPDFEKVGELVQPTADVRKGLRDLRVTFTSNCKKEWRDEQKSWHEINNLLTVPFIAANLRKGLLTRLHEISKQLNNKAPANNPGGANPAEMEQQARAAALQQASLAVALVGRKEDPDARDMGEALRRAKTESWQPLLLAAGDRFANAFQRLADEAATNAEKGRTAALQEAGPLLNRSTQNARRLDGAAVAAWLKLTADPVGELRELQMHNLLTWQAQRTYHDYRASEDPRKPYYRLAGALYLADAKQVIAGPGIELTPEQRSARLQQVSALETKLNAPDAFAVRWLDGKNFRSDKQLWHVTDEERYVRVYDVAAPAEAPDGLIALWPEKVKGLRRKDSDLARRLVPLHAQAGEGAVRYELEREPGIDGDVTEQVAGYFRGRHFELSTPVRLHGRPNIVAYNPVQPSFAYIAVQSRPEDFAKFAAINSELVIVFDYSGSMEPENGPKPSRKTRAIRALRACLNTLPQGVQVTLLTFSQAQNGGGIRVQWPKAPWAPDQLDEKIKQLERLTPYGRTPLVEATAEARKYFTAGFNGAKTIVVLTDGGDNEFYRKAERRAQGDTMARFLRDTFKDTGILVNVIGFELKELTDKDEIAGYKEYKDAIEALGGKVQPVDKSEDLARELERFIMQFRFWIEPENPNVQLDEQTEGGNRISRMGENLSWIEVPAPGGYWVRLQANRKYRNAMEQRVSIERGDKLVLNLIWKGEREFQLQRDLYAEREKAKNNVNVLALRKLGSDWRLGVLENYHIGRNRTALQLLVTTEKEMPPVPSNVSLRQIRPAFVWFNLAPNAGRTGPLTGLRFMPLTDYPAPAWDLKVEDWMADQKTILDAWVREDKLASARRLRRDIDFKSLSDLTAFDVQANTAELGQPVPVRVESVKQERRRVEVRPDVWVNDVDCLVVRLSYPIAGQPFYVQLPEEFGVLGSEHRFYTEAGKYTGIFWTIREDQAKTLPYLDLISVAAAQEKAFHVDKLDLGVPTTTQKRPAPVKAKN